MRGPKAVPSGVISGLVHGAMYPIEALGFIRRERLWALAALPILINVALLVVLIVATVVFVTPVVDGWLQGLAALGGGSSFLSGLVTFAGWLVWVLVVLVVFAGNALVLLMLGQAVASPFLDVLSERVETIVLGTRPAPFSLGRVARAVVMAVGDIVWTLGYWVLANLPLLVLGFVLPPVAAALGFAFSALLVAQEFIGLALARELVPFRERWRQLRGNRSLAVGFGSTCMLLFAVPGLNLVLLPLAAVGGTLLYSDLVAAGRMRRAAPARSSSAAA